MANLNVREFVNSIPVIDDFSKALEMQGYVPLPDDWYVAVTDVVKSREAIKRGLYKPVNMAGVAIISAVMNTLGHQQIPYIFGGDGAAIACSPVERDTVETVLQQTVGWVSDDLNLELRASLIPVSELRKLGVDILVSGVRVSDAVINFGFTGGGIAKAEAMMKEGQFRVYRGENTEKPDLTGLSCRWTAIGEEKTSMVSIIIEPAEGDDVIAPEILSEILISVKGHQPEGNPMPEDGPGFSWPTPSSKLEAKATGQSTFTIQLVALLALFLFKTGIKLGDFDARRYWKKTSLNTDYRKIQDGLRMTISLAKDEVGALREKLEGFRESGAIRFGLCEQDKAVLTCYVPSITDDAHFHFLDGAGGGYAAAADNIH